MPSAGLREFSAMNRKRRGFVGGVVVGVLTAPLHELVAQPAAKRARIALVFEDTAPAARAKPDPANPYARAFALRLEELGWVEGSNLVIERRSFGDRPERLPALMQELVAMRVEAIVTIGEGAIAASLATATIPIIAMIDSPERAGLTRSLARPTRNVTGLTGDAGPGMYGKRLQLLNEAAPAATRIAVIDYKYIDAQATPGTHARRLELEDAARALGVTLVHVGVDRVEDIEPALLSIVAQRAEGLLDTGTPFEEAQRVIAFAARQRLPAIYVAREDVERGGLMAYGTNIGRLSRRMAELTDRVLRGAKPADLPFEQPTSFELVINARTARTLGLTLPAKLLLRADEVID